MSPMVRLFALPNRLYLLFTFSFFFFCLSRVWDTSLSILLLSFFFFSFHFLGLVLFFSPFLFFLLFFSRWFLGLFVCFFFFHWVSILFFPFRDSVGEKTLTKVKMILDCDDGAVLDKCIELLFICYLLNARIEYNE